MDLTSAVTYRGVELNSAVGPLAPGASVIVGNQIESALWHSIAGVGYTEKRARDDGKDASDVYLDGRRLTLSGVTHGSSHGDAQDRFAEVMAAFAPTLAYGANSDELGYLPLYFKRRTARLDDFPSGLIDLFSNMRPLALPSFPVNRDSSGDDAAKPADVRWEVTLEAIDPRLYVDELIEVEWEDPPSGTLVHRGNYPSPLFVFLNVAASGIESAHFVVGDSDFTFTILADALAQTITFDGLKRIVNVTRNGQTYLQMNVLQIDSSATPFVPPGGCDWEWAGGVGGGGLIGGSLLYYREAFI